MGELNTYDFGDGKGPVAAHRHSNGGGWVAGTAYVSDEAFVGWDARVYGRALVARSVHVYNQAQVYGNACLKGEARVFGDARVYGSTQVMDRAEVFGDAHVYNGATISGGAKVFGDARVYGGASVSGFAHVEGRASVFGLAHVSGLAHLDGDAVIGRCADILSTQVRARSGVYPFTLYKSARREGPDYKKPLANWGCRRALDPIAWVSDKNNEYPPETQKIVRALVRAWKLMNE